MNSRNHHQIIELAVAALPPGSRAFWEPLAATLSETCMVPDQYAIPLLNGEDGPWRRFFPATVPKHSFEKLGAAARVHFFDLRFYVDRVLALLTAGNLPEACRFLGVLAHHLGDFGEPAHYYEHEITLLLPPPPDRRNCNSHRLIEDTVSLLAGIDHPPRVLGDTAGSIVLRLEGRLRELYETSLAVIVPMLTALYRRDSAAAGRVVGPVVAATAGVLADLLHTLWCLHTRSWTVAERASLDLCRLEALEPAAYDVEFNYGCRPLREAVTIDQVGQAVPLRLRCPAADGTVTVRPVAGLCLVPHALPLTGTLYQATVEFDLPPGEFARFTGSVGLLAEFRPQAVCRFSVEVDGHPVFTSRPMTEADTAIDITASLGDCRRLRLVVQTDGSTDKLAFPIWADPAIHRATRGPIQA